MSLLLAKGDDIAEWRDVDDFVGIYRNAAIKLAASRSPDAISQFLNLVEAQLQDSFLENERANAAMDLLSSEIADSTDQSGVREKMAGFYGLAYSHFTKFRSVPAFFTAANGLLKSLAAMITASAIRDSDTSLPPFSVVVMGPAGRLEFTRFCRIQLAMVWDGDGGDAENEAMEAISTDIVAGLRSCGVSVDEFVTPVHPEWRGSLTQWRKRIVSSVDKNNARKLIETLRLVDQTILVDSEGVGERFRNICSEQFARRNAVVNLASRCLGLSNGLGMMGGLKLEKSGPHRGKFALLDHALIPLAVSVATICLNNDIVEDGTPRRLRELVRNSRIDIDLAERALNAWHLFSGHRLSLELTAVSGQDCRDILNIDVSNLDTIAQETLRSALETVANLQRFLQATSGKQA